MKKYYRRLTWGFIILLTVFAVAFAVYLTRKEAERILALRDNTWTDTVNKQCNVFYDYISNRLLKQNGENDPLWPWDEERRRTIATEALWYTMAFFDVDYYWGAGRGSTYIESAYDNQNCGAAGDLCLNGELLNISKSFIVLNEGWPTEPIFAVLPGSFFKMESYWYGPNEISPARVFSFRPECHITGKRYENTVYIDTIEFFMQGTEEMEDACWKYELSYAGVEVPKDALPYEFTSTKFRMHCADNEQFDERDFYFAEYYDLDYTKHDADWRWGGFENEIRRFEEAEKSLERAAEEIRRDEYEFNSLSDDYRTLTQLDVYGYQSDWENYFGNGGDDFPSLLLAYTFRPIREARENLLGVYICLALFLVVSILIVMVLVHSLRKNQERYERNRLAMTRAVAHELKTPLAVTKSYVENWSDIDESRREEYQKDMSEQIDYVNGLVGDLLELSRMEMKAKELNREPVNLGELNDMVLGKLSALTADREVTVNKPDDTESLTVQADLGMMRTVLMNLITNAIRYGEKKIVIDISKKRDAVRYQITNDGTPIPADQLDLIWDAFYMVDPSRANRKFSGADSKSDKDSGAVREGTGLGLAITRQILELHGAKYGCTSDAKGTVVYFEL